MNVITPKLQDKVSAFLVTLLLVLFTLTCLQAVAGEGRNGPELEGPAIPVHVDKAVTVKDLKSATSVCGERAMKNIAEILFKGEGLYERHGNKSESESFLHGNRQNNSYLVELDYVGFTNIKPGLGYSSAASGYFLDFYLENEKRDALAYNYYYIFFTKGQFFNADQSVNQYKQIVNIVYELLSEDGRVSCSNSPVAAEVVCGLPVFKYNKEIGEKSYDPEYGFEVDTNVIARSVQIVSPSGQWGKHYLSEMDTGHKIKHLAIDFTDYRNCLINEISK